MIDEKILKRAAGWIYRNRHTEYWTPLILAANIAKDPDVLALKLTVSDAEAVFSALEEKGFLTKKGDGKINIVPGFSIQAYWIRMANLRDFRKFSEFPFYYNFLPDSWIYYFEKYWAWFVVCAALVITSFLNGFVGELGKWVGEKLIKHLP